MAAVIQGWRIALATYHHDILNRPGKVIPQGDFFSQYSGFAPAKQCIFISPAKPEPMQDLFNLSTSYYPSVISVAGKRWEPEVTLKPCQVYTPRRVQYTTWRSTVTCWPTDDPTFISENSSQRVTQTSSRCEENEFWGSSNVLVVRTGRGPPRNGQVLWSILANYSFTWLGTMTHKLHSVTACPRRLLQFIIEPIPCADADRFALQMARPISDKHANHMICDLGV